MPETIELVVTTPERELVREPVEALQAPGKRGYLGILPGHAPLLSELGAGYLSYSAAGRKRYLAVAGGFLEVLPGHVRVLADMAERAEEIDVDRARQALREAMERLSHASTGEESAEATALVERESARIAAVEQG